MSISETATAVVDHLPPNWQIDIELREDYCCLKLFDAAGNEAELANDELSIDELFEIAVDYARVSDGLSPHFDANFCAEDYLI